MEEIMTINNSEVITDLIEPNRSDNRFILANTVPILFQDLKEKCIIPSYAKDLESAISHTELLEAVMFAAQSYFKRESILEPAIRTSHEIRGRVPGALGKPVVELQPEDQTLYYARMAFNIEIPTIRESINGNLLNLSITGVRSYDLDHLNGKKKEEIFKVAIGFLNRVCCNLCIWSEGYKAEIRASSINEIIRQAFSLFCDFRPEQQLSTLAEMGDYSLTESQFAHLIGRSRLYQFLPVKTKKEIKDVIPLMDSQVSTVARDYYSDRSFCRNADGDLNLWKLYNLMTGSLKTSYIDTWLDRSAGASSFIGSVQNALKQGSYHWFLS
jgi:predicted nucleic-acid-binding Zn-ribbon protein